MPEIIDEAVIRLGLDNNLTGPLARAVEEAKAEVEALGRTKAKIQVDADTEKARAELKLLQKELDSAAARQKAYQKLFDDAEGAKKGGYATALKNAKANADAARQEVQSQRDVVQAYQQKGRVIGIIGRDVQKTLQDEAKAQKEVTAATKEAQKAAEDATTADLKRAQQVQKSISLQRQYADSQKKLNDLQKAYSRAQGSDKARVKLDTAGALADMELLREKLKLMGEKPIDINTDVKSSGGSIIKRITGGDDPRILRDLGNEVSDFSNKLKGARVNVGPFSTSLYGIVAAATVLSPMILGLVGALGSLVSIVGAGLAGGIGLGAAAMTGFGLAAIGVVGAVKPFITQLSQAHTYQTALNTAIAKYGPNSKQAAAAQKIFNNEMKTISPTAREAVKGFQDLKTEWQKATQAVATQDVGKIIGASLKTAQSDMKFFAADTKTALNDVTAGWGRWMAQLRGEDKGPLNNIFKNFDSSIKPVMSGLGHLGDAFLRITSSFSNFLPGIAKGFNAWAKNLDNAAKNSNGFANGVRTMVGAFRDLGHFIQAAGGFLLSFFKAGVGPGGDLLNKMTASLQKLTTQMNTTSGQSRLQGFFARSVETTMQLWKALMPLISAFVQFGQATAPVANVMLEVVSAFTKLVSLAVGWKPLQLVAGGALGLLAISKLTATLREAAGLSASLAKNLFTALSTSRDMGPINAFKTAFGGSGSVLTAAGETLQAAAEAQSAAAGELSGAAAELSGAAGASRIAAEAPVAGGAVRAAETAAPVVEGAAAGEVAAAAPEVEGGLAAVGTAMVEFATGPVGIAVGAIAALAAGVAILGSSTQNVADVARKNSFQAVKAGNQSLATGAGGPAFTSSPNQPIGGRATDQQAVNQAAAAYYKLLDAGKGSSAAAKDALASYNEALQTQNTDLQNAQTYQKAVTKTIGDQVKVQMGDQLKAQKSVNDATKAYNDDLKQQKEGNLVNPLKTAQDLKDLRDAQSNLNAVSRQGIELANQSSAAKLNEQRALKGLVPVSAQYAQSVGQLTRSLVSAGPAGARALKQLTDIPDPSKVQGLASAFNALTSVTDKTKAIKIIADTSNPIQAIAKLNALQLKEKILKLLSNGGDNVVAAIGQINGRPLPAKVLRLLGNAQDAMAKHQQVSALQDVQKALHILGDDGSAMSAISSVLGAINALPSSRNITITTSHVDTFTTRNLGSPGGSHAATNQAMGKGLDSYAGGASPSLRATQAIAARTALGKPTKKTQGGLYSNPTYLVGEENRPEFVISTNPIYRQKNQEYLKQAASLFGGHVEGFASGRGQEHAAKSHKPAPPKAKHQKFTNSVYDLPAKDRIGGIGTADISTAISNTQGFVSNDNSAVSSAKSKVNSDNAAIKRYTGLKKPTQLEKNDLKNARADLPGANKKLKAAEAKLAKDKGTLKNLNGILASANDNIQQFTNLENEISSVGSLMDAASNSPSDSSTGVNPLTGNIESKTWSQWRDIEVNLEKQHNSKLQAAWKDVKKRVGKVTSSTAVGYVKQLAAALSQSIAEEAATADATDSGAGQAQVGAPESLSDFLTQIKYGGISADQALAGLETQYNTDQIGALQDPGNPAYASAQQADTAAIVAFYQNVLGQAKGWTNKSYPGAGLTPDPALLQETTGALLTALQDQQGITASLQGPSQAQLTGTALSSLYTNYGGNTAGLLLGAAMGMSPTDMSAALAGGQVAQDALSGNASAAASAQIGGGGTASAPGSNKSVTQHITIQQPPDDPHIWAKGIGWELDSLA